MKLGVYMSLDNAALFVLKHEIGNSYVIWWKEYEICAISKKDFNSLNVEFLGEF